jgi:hypothetical protein
MADAEKPSDAAHATSLGSAHELREIWSHFRAGDVVHCPIDGSPLALAVDAAIGVYRFVCTRCGAASAWFEAGPAGIRLRGQAHQGPGAGHGDDE